MGGGLSRPPPHTAPVPLPYPLLCIVNRIVLLNQGKVARCISFLQCIRTAAVHEHRTKPLGNAPWHFPSSFRDRGRRKLRRASRYLIDECACAYDFMGIKSKKK